jgi:hypothetical protein
MKSGRHVLAFRGFHRFLPHVAAALLMAAPILLLPPAARSQTPPAQGIPIEHCDGLPVMKVRAAGVEKRFLVDTAANSILDSRSFSGGEWKHVEISSWKGADTAQAREITLTELEIGGRSVHNLKLRAIDLSGIAKTCGGKIDGILGFDLMEKMGITIDLKRKMAQIEDSPDMLRVRLNEMESAMHGCSAAFGLGNVAELAECFDPEIILYTHGGEFHGKKQVMDYLQGEYLKYAPNVNYTERMKEARLFGDVLWYTYDYSLETPRERQTGHGMAMCRRSGPRWRIINMHNSLLPQGEPSAKALPPVD